MNRRLERVLSDPFYARFGRAAIGMAGAPLFTIAVTPVLTRLYSVPEWGVFAVFMGFVNIANKFCCLNYDRAILIPEEGRDAAAVFNLSLLIATAISGLVGVGVLIAALVADPGVEWVVLPVTVLMVGLRQATHQWTNRADRQGALGASRLIEAVVTVLLQAGFFYVPAVRNIGLEAGYLGGLLVAQLVLAVVIARDDAGQLIAALRRDLVIAVAKRYRSFPLVNMWFGGINAIANRAPVFLMLLLFGSEAAGYFGLANRVLSAPSLLIGQSAGLALGKTFMEEKHKGGHGGAAVRRTISLMFGFAVIPITVVLLFGVPLFELVFGGNWATAGLFARFLAPMVLFQLVIFPLANVLILLERHAVLVRWAAIRLAWTAVAFFVADAFFGATAAVLLYSGGQIIVWGLLLVWILRATRVSWRSLVSPRAAPS